MNLLNWKSQTGTTKKMMTKTEMREIMQTLSTAFKKLAHEGEVIFKSDSLLVDYQPSTEAKLIADTYSEREHPGKEETSFMVSERDIYCLYGDHREAMRALNGDVDALIKYWREHHDQWSHIPAVNNEDKEDEKKPEIGFGIPVAKAA